MTLKDMARLRMFVINRAILIHSPSVVHSNCDSQEGHSWDGFFGGRVARIVVHA